MFNWFNKKFSKKKENVKNVDKIIKYGIHNIKEPIHSTLWILKKINEEIDNDENRYKNIIHNIVDIELLVNYISSVIDNFYDINKMSYNELELICKPIDIVEIVKNIFICFREVNETEHIKFYINLEIDIKIINIDANKIKQILLNGYRYLLKCTKKGNISTEVFFKDNKLFINISSDGMTNIKNRNLDTDMELQTSKFLAIKMMGDFDITNKKNKITLSFWFYNMIYNKEEIILENVNNNNEHISIVNKNENIKVAYCEDDMLNNKIMNCMLKKIKISDIKSFYDGSEYLEFVKKNEWRPDFLITDIVMTNIDGDLLCKKLRKMNHDYSIIAATGNLLTEDITTQYLDIGFTKIINKPYNINKLKQVMNIL